MRAHEFITERISEVVYHATIFEDALAILQSNVLKSSAAQISVTRSLTGAYHRYNKMIGIIFELDGNKINQRYKGGPVGTEDWESTVHIDDLEDGSDYEGLDPESKYVYEPNNDQMVKVPANAIKNANEKGFIDMGPYYGNTGRKNKQFEDRIYTKEIKNISEYIKSAIIYAPVEYLDNQTMDEFDYNYVENIKHVAAIVNLLEELSIPYRFVSSEKNMFNKNANDKDTFVQSLKKYHQRGEDIGDQNKQMFISDIEFELLYQVNKLDPETENFIDAGETKKIIKAKDFDEAVDKGESIIDDIDNELNKDLPKGHSGFSVWLKGVRNLDTDEFTEV